VVDILFLILYNSNIYEMIMLGDILTRFVFLFL